MARVLKKFFGPKKKVSNKRSAYEIHQEIERRRDEAFLKLGTSEFYF